MKKKETFLTLSGTGRRNCQSRRWISPTKKAFKTLNWQQLCLLWKHSLWEEMRQHGKERRKQEESEKSAYAVYHKVRWHYTSGCAVLLGAKERVLFEIILHVTLLWWFSRSPKKYQSHLTSAEQHVKEVMCEVIKQLHMPWEKCWKPSVAQAKKWVTEKSASQIDEKLINFPLLIASVNWREWESFQSNVCHM